MRIKMKTLMTLLALIVGFFMIGDLFLFSSVGKHNVHSDTENNNPYKVGNVRFIKRQIKSGREYITDGIKNFAEKLYEGDYHEENEKESYDGVRSSVLGAMEVPGMQQKVLPMQVDPIPSEFSRLQKLEQAMMDGRFEEEEAASEEEIDENDMIRQNEEQQHTEPEQMGELNDEQHYDAVDEEGPAFWAGFFNFGSKTPQEDAPKEVPAVQPEAPLIGGQVQPGVPSIGEQPGAGVPVVERLGIDNIQVPGMDNRIMSKFAHTAESNNDPLAEELLRKKESIMSNINEPSEEELEDQWLLSQIKPEDKGLAKSVPEPPVLSEPVPTQKASLLSPQSPRPSAAYNFIANLFQFAGSTGDDDENDGGWASVGELDSMNKEGGNIFDSVQRAMVPGMQQKLVPHDIAPMDQRPPEQYSDRGEPSLDGVQSFEVAAIPGFGDDFFQKYGRVRQVQEPEPAMPVASNEQPPDVVDESDMQYQVALPANIQSEGLQIANIPGLSDEFYQKFKQANDEAKNALPQSQIQSAEIQIPNIPGLGDDFFIKYGGAQPDNDLFQQALAGKPSELPQQAVPTPQETIPVNVDEMQVPEVPGLSADFFNKFIHPVAQGQANPILQADDSMMESLEEVPGLPDDFFDKYIRGQSGESPRVDGQALRDQGFEFPDIPGLSDYLSKYADAAGQALPPGGIESLKESLLRAQMQVPGMPEKVLPDDLVLPDNLSDLGPGILDGVPPSDIPELEQYAKSPQASKGLFALLMSAGLPKLYEKFAQSKQVAQTGVLPTSEQAEPGGNLTESLIQGLDEPVWPPQQDEISPEEGFQVKAQETPERFDMAMVLKALMPDFNITGNETDHFVDPGEALGLLNQLQGVQPEVGIGGIAAQPANLSQELANITALEDSRVVQCNLTKSSMWKVAITDRWHTVKDGLMFVYSSFLDDRIRGHTAIRILGLLEGWEVGMHLKPFCQVWFQDKDAPFVIGATYEWLPGQPIAKFKAVLLTCVYQTSHVPGKPLAVSLTTEPCEPPKFLVKIHTRNETVGIKKTNFTICLTGPMKFGYADVGQFIQWMEFNIMMGVERFVLYNHSMDAALRPYLVHYAKMGYVQLFPWIIPDNIPNPLVFLKNLGHLAMINDCLYRNMWTSNYVVFMDIDEMILPRYGHATFTPMLKNAGCDKKPQAVVQSVFFRREWPNDELYSTNETVINMGLVGLLKTKRERKIWPPYMRSKYFIKPDEVLICNVHAAHSFLSPLAYQDLSCIFNPKEVILHHYRYWGEVTGNYVVDRRLHEYGDDIITRAAGVYEAVLGRKVI